MPSRRHTSPLSRLASLALACALLAPPFAPPAAGSAAGESASRTTVPAAPAAAKSAPRRQGKAAYRAGQLLVRLREDVGESERGALAAREGAGRRELRGASRVELWTLATGRDVEATSLTLTSHPAIEFAEPNYVISADQFAPSDPRFAEQWALRNAGQSVGEARSDINVLRAWSETTGSARTVVAVVDGGIDFTHPDLARNRWANPSDPPNGRDDDGDGLVDDTSGWDWVAGSGEAKDPAGHGTAVAGLIAAEGNNRIGTAGVMWRASLMSLRVLDERGTGDVASAVEAIDYASSHGAHVINCSWGADAVSRALSEAISRAGDRGALVVASAGNDGRNVDAQPRYPASYDLPHVVAAAATNNLDQLTPWSNWGAGRARVAAPGVDLLTTEPGGGYRVVSGTSTSAALVTGVAGLIKTLRPGLAPARVREVLMRGVRPVAGLAGRVSSGGVVSAGGSSAVLASMPPGEGEEDAPDQGRSEGEPGSAGNPDFSTATPGRPATQPERRPVTPLHPVGNLPDLNQLRLLESSEPETPEAVPSTRPNHRRGRRHPQGGAGVSSTQGWGADFIRAKYLSPLRSVRVAFNNMLGGGGAASPVTARDFLGGPLYAAAAVETAAAPVLSVTAASDSRVELSWTESVEAPAYRIERSLDKSWASYAVFTATSTWFPDTGVSRGVNGTAYLYRVCASDGANGCSSPYSNVALGTAYSFLEPQLVSYAEDPVRATTIKARHVTDLREAVNAVRRAALLPEAGWQVAGSDLAGATVRASHVQELRERLSEGLASLGIPADAFEDPALATGAGGTPIKKVHFEELRRRSTAWPGVLIQGGSSTAHGLSEAAWAETRLDPANRMGGSGVDLLSGNANWSLPLVSLPGRSGLDLGLSLTYNSRVWTKSGGHIGFDLDRGFPAPGFRLGFPTIQPRFYNALTTKHAYLLITANGDHVELRETVTSGPYEAADSSYMQLTEGPGGSLILRPPDGSRLAFSLIDGQYHCTEIKDRNGNYLSVSYDAAGQIRAVTDTLGRVITFNYDPYQNLVSITQKWPDSTKTDPSATYARRWATFGWGEQTIQTNFAGLTLSGIQNGTTIPVLKQVGLPDGTVYRFDYTPWGQVRRVSRHTQTFEGGKAIFPKGYTERASTAYGLRDDGGAETDCPRVMSVSAAAEEWNGGSAATTAYEYGGEDASGRWGEATAPPAGPDTAGSKYKETYGTGWKRGLVTKAEEFAPGAAAATKKTTTEWAQNDGSLAFELNPRAAKIVVEDSASNKRQTVFEYDLRSGPLVKISAGDPAGVVSLPTRVREETGTGALLRSTRLNYETSDPYLNYETSDPYLNVNHRLVGLVTERTIHDAADQLVSKATYLYDQPDEPAAAGGEAVQYLMELNSNLQQTPTVQHDPAYGLGYGDPRGNLNIVRRWDVKALTDESKASSFKTGYSTTGSVVLSIDPEDHRSTIKYTDSFSDAARNGTKFAYPTKVIDAEGYSSRSTYNYDFGAVTESESPLPNQTAKGVYGPKRLMTYDRVGRLVRVSNSFNGAHTRWVYTAALTSVHTYTLLKEGSPVVESFSSQLFDGAGRVRAASRNMAEAGRYSGQKFVYDRLGRLANRSNPTEMTGDWVEAGDDAPAGGGAGWVYSAQAYDWRGRPTITTGQDGTTQTAEYDGCGCAGGEVVTVSGPTVMLPPQGGAGAFSPGNRRLRTTHDVLGRTVKAEILNRDGTPYRTTVTEYDARDQVVKVKEYKGAANEDGSCPSGSCQVTAMGYDGHGRLETRRLPEQSADTVYTYNRDDTLQREEDPRGATLTYGYDNKRHLVSGITFAAPSSISGAPPLSFDYDAAGNRQSQTDKAGTVTYEYDQLSRLKSETRTFSSLAANAAHTLGYTYNLANQLESVTDPTGAKVDYAYDGAGQLNRVVAATAYGNVSQGAEYASGMKYRAWGALKESDYGNGLKLSVGYDVRQLVKLYHVRRPAEPAGTADLMLGDYEYEADGRIKKAYDRTDPRFDRSYLYDLVGRLSYATTSSGAYSQSFAYDEFGNMTSRGNLSWRFLDHTVSEYRDNRNTKTTIFPSVYPTNNPPQPSYWGYDQAGNVTGDHNKVYTHDAAGDKVSAFENSGDGARKLWIYQDYDADGERLKRVEQTQSFSGPVTTVTSYYVRSSVLGRVVTELDGQGAKKLTYVYSNGAVVAKQENSQVRWVHADPVTKSVREADAGGYFASRQEFDPLGNDTPLSDPAPADDPTPDYLFPGTYGNGGNPYDGASGCSVDGQPWSCAAAARLVNHGVAVVDRIFDLLPVGQTQIVPVSRPDVHIPGTNDDPDNHAFDGGTTLGFLDTSFIILQGPGGRGQVEPSAEDRAVTRAEEFLANRNRECANFIAELIYMTATYTAKDGDLMTPYFGPLGAWGTVTPSFSPDYALSLYRTAQREGRVTASNLPGTDGNLITYGRTSGHHTISWNREFYNDLSRDEQARHTLHESLHLIANFTDFALAGAAHMLATRNRTSPGTTGNFADQPAASRYLNEQIARYCR